MGISTCVHTVKQHEIDQLMVEVVKSLKNGFGEKFISDSVEWRDVNKNFNTDTLFFEMNFTLDYENSNFRNNKENRNIGIFHYPEIEMKRDFYIFYFGAWGHNKEIANCLVDYFGGYADYNDCDNVEMDYCINQYQSKLGVNEQ